jgi:hypothetical protein
MGDAEAEKDKHIEKDRHIMKTSNATKSLISFSIHASSK